MADADRGEGLTAWAGAHGLTVEAGARLPRTTPLLAEGEVHSVDALIGGWLSKYVEAKIALISRDDAQSPSPTCRRRSGSCPGCSATGSRTRGCSGAPPRR